MSAAKVDRRNRVRFAILGLLLLVLGVLGLLARFDVLPADEPSDVYRQLKEALTDYRVFMVLGLVLLGLLLLWYGLRLLRQQVSTPGLRVKELTLQDSPVGRTTVDADVLSRAITRDVERLPAVQSASARLLAAGPKPRFVVHAAVERGAEIGRVREALEEVHDHVRQSLGTHEVASDLVVRPVGPGRRRLQ